MSFLGLSCMSTLLEIFMDQHPLVRRVVSLSITNLHFSVSITVTLFIIGENHKLLIKKIDPYIVLRCCLVTLQTSAGITVGVVWSSAPSGAPGKSLGQQQA